MTHNGELAFYAALTSRNKQLVAADNLFDAGMRTLRKWVSFPRLCAKTRSWQTGCSEWRNGMILATHRCSQVHLCGVCKKRRLQASSTRKTSFENDRTNVADCVANGLSPAGYAAIFRLTHTAPHNRSARGIENRLHVRLDVGHRDDRARRLLEYSHEGHSYRPRQKRAKTKRQINQERPRELAGFTM
jgi:hypothetical protein